MKFLASNGSTYKGLTIGSGWDCEIRRESDDTVLVNVMSPDGANDYLGTWEIETADDLQALAVEIASHPGAPRAYDLVDDNAGDWPDLAERWNNLA